jgi:3-isopropylmalate dehydrogenase
MFGDILSDEAAELSGSLGLAGSINVGEHHCMAQAQHGSAPDIQAQNKANPTSLVLSCAMLLDWLGRRHHEEHFTAAARLIEQSVDVVLSNPALRTFDLGGPLGTHEFASELCKQMDGRARD